MAAYEKQVEVSSVFAQSLKAIIARQFFREQISIHCMHLPGIAGGRLKQYRNILIDQVSLQKPGQEFQY